MCLREKIPLVWRDEEIMCDEVINDENLVNYLENYGALALLIFLRSQKAANLSNENKKNNYKNRKL